MKSSLIVLLTATVRPKANQPELKLVDPDVRLEEYRQSLLHLIPYLENGLVGGVVFAENSTYRVSELRDEFSKHGIEFISYEGLDYPDGFHRGYGEYLLMSEAMARSELIQGLDERGVVLKITGRYKVLNLATLVSRLGGDFDLVCERRESWAEMSVMCWTKQGFSNCLSGLQALFSGGMPPEVYLDGHLKTMTGSGKRIEVFPWPPLLSGKRGTDGGAHSTQWSGIKIALTGVWRTVRRMFLGA
jgi:hypothetical protein